jgi:hypothetical protein
MYSRVFDLEFGIVRQEASVMLKSEAGEAMDLRSLPFVQREYMIYGFDRQSRTSWLISYLFLQYFLLSSAMDRRGICSVFL